MAARTIQLTVAGCTAQVARPPLSTQRRTIGNYAHPWSRVALSRALSTPAPRRIQVQRLVPRADGGNEEPQKAPEPKNCKQAIDVGLELYRQKQFSEAIAVFQKSLELPGSGVMRLSGTVREYSCPSTGEENAALYNMACAYCQLGQAQSALTCVQGVLENEFDDFKALRTDPDLAALQGPELEALIGKFESPIDKISSFLGVKKQRDSGTNKPWLLW
mmetsp:Transcript_28679/g.80745  ORF Transcript_28679/g.80745 Transcript_28679/m.80745 type:complete len:218 (-) Transcript_28679:201-854(-)